MVAPWKSMLQKALDANKQLPYGKFFQIATLRPDGRPACRTVVFRGFLEDTDGIMFCSDTRTEKVSQLQANSAAEACWYFEDSREQFRLSGELHIAQGDCTDSRLKEARTRVWGELSPNARKQFVYPDPGKPRVQDEGKFDPEPPSGDNAPLDTFALIVLDVDTVDYTEYTSSKGRKEFEKKGGEWTEKALNP